MSYVPPKDEGEEKKSDIGNPSPNPPIASVTAGQLNPSDSKKIERANGTKPKEKWSELDLQDRLIVLLTAGIFLLTGLTAYIFLRQANIMQSQLDEMRGSGEQTERLIILNQGQLIQTGRAVEKIGEEVSQLSRSADETHAIARGAQENTVRELRPYVWLANQVGDKSSVYVTYFAQAQQFAVTFHYTNFGRSPAVNLQTSKSLYYGADALSQIKTLPLPPNETLLPTGKEDFFSVVSRRVSQEEFSTLMHSDSYIVVAARLRYSDISGRSYETDLCMQHFAVDSWAWCETNNEIKDCSKRKCEP
jgi:hypothetical protein